MMAGQTNLQTILTSPSAAKLAYMLCRLLPPRMGYSLARSIAGRIADRPDMPVVQAMRINQWMSDPTCRDRLDAAVRDCLGYIAIGFYQLFRNYSRPQAMQRLVAPDPRIDELIARSHEQRSGLMIAGLHMSGFDLVSQAIFQRGLRAMALSLPETTETIEWQHDLRRRSGVDIRPPTIANLRLAVERLQQGGLVMTGIDRPMPGLKYTPRLFGRPARLPTHHIYLALKARVPVLVVGAEFREDGKYHLLVSPEVHLQPETNHRGEMLVNAERVLALAETIICQAPRQWTVPYPLWPEVETEMVSRG
jgi:KDO2-lipid IV(A) lauroyltransferase